MNTTNQQEKYPQKNKQAGRSNHETYESAMEAKDCAVATGLYSKVKIIKRKVGNFHVVCYTQLKEGC